MGKTKILIGTVDFVTSKKIYEEYKHTIRKNECYFNVFNLSCELKEEFESGIFNIGYGYCGKKELAIRHCYIVKNDNSIIDPSLFSYGYSDKSIREPHYFTFAIVQDKDWLELIRKNDNELDLSQVLKQKERVFNDYRKINRINVHEVDYIQYLQKFDDEWAESVFG